MTDSNAIGDSQGELDNDQAVRRFGGSLGQVKRTLQNTYDDLLLKDSTSDEDDECSNRTPWSYLIDIKCYKQQCLFCLLMLA